MKLNREQLSAVRHKNGPLLIIAGAGTGKTTVITERIKHLVLENIAKPSEILALTFTEKAAEEMQERVDVAIPYGYTQMWIMTFHSFCDQVLRRDALHIGLDTRYKLNSDSESIQFIKKNLFAFDLDYFRPLGNPTKFVDGLLQHFSRLQDEEILPDDYIRWVKRKKKEIFSQKKTLGKDAEILEKEIAKWEELSSAYKTYDELKMKNSVLDFGDLIVKTLILFKRRPNILEEYRKRFRYILVDEFQDTNIAQNELVKLLAGSEKNITAVLDDDQSIYHFRGASVSNALYFRKSFPNAKVVTLTSNYRSSQDILDCAYRLIQHNNPDRLEIIEGVDKKLISQRKNVASDIKFIHKKRVEDEAEFVAKEIIRLKEEKQLSYKDFAILVRANNHSDPFIRSLSRFGIPYQFLGPGKLFKRPEVIDMISYLKVLYNFEDSVSLYRLLSLDYLGIPQKDLVRILNYSRKKNISFFEACEEVDKIFVKDETKAKIKQVTDIVNGHISILNSKTAGFLLYDFLEKSGILQKLINPDTPFAERKVQNISKFFDRLKSYETKHEDSSVFAVVDWLDLASELGESPLAEEFDWTTVDAVNILTIHSSKGLEFPVVFLVNLVSQRFPTVERREQIPIPEELIKEVLPQGDYHLQEERRLFYVGMTRAMDTLYFTAASYYGDGRREKKISPFVFEALGDDVSGAEFATKEAEQLSFIDYKSGEDTEITSDVDSEMRPNIDSLSYSQIETFRTCPLHFKLKYIYNLPHAPSASQSFGSSIHQSLRVFYERIREGAKPSERMIFKIFENNWIGEGFVSKSHEEKFFQKGKLYLSGFLKYGFNAKTVPAALEQKFVIFLPPKDGERPLRIKGVIDRIDVFEDGSIEIIDYKTGATIPSQKEVDGNLQLTFYALAATYIKEPPFGMDVDRIKLSLYFLDSQEKITTTRDAKSLERAVDEIYEIRKEIESSDFRCSGSMLCEACEYKLLCNSDTW